MKNKTIAIICALFALALFLGWCIWAYLDFPTAILAALAGVFIILIGSAVFYGVYDVVSEVLNANRENPPKKEKRNKWIKE